MGIYAIKPAFQASLRAVEHQLIARNISADAITLAALSISIGGGIAFALSGNNPALLLAAPVVALTRTALNALDGMVAIDTGTARPFGEVLNEFTDRLADAVLFAGFALAGTCNPNLAWAAALLAVLSDDIGVLSKAAGGPRQYGGMMGKADRMVILAIAAPLAFLTGAHWILNAMLAVIAVGSVATIIERGRKSHADL